MPEAELYFTKTEAFEYSKRQDYPFAKSKFFADLQFVPRKKNKFAKSDIDKHIKDKVINSSGLTAGDEAGEKIRQETRTAKARADKLEFEYEVALARYIPVSTIEQELAHRGALLKSGIENFFATKGRKMIELCGGSPENEAAFINFCLASVEDHFDQYAQNIDFAVPVVKPEAEEDIED